MYGEPGGSALYGASGGSAVDGRAAVIGLWPHVRTGGFVVAVLPVQITVGLPVQLTAWLPIQLIGDVGARGGRRRRRDAAALRFVCPRQITGTLPTNHCELLSRVEMPGTAPAAIEITANSPYKSMQLLPCKSEPHHHAYCCSSQLRTAASASGANALNVACAPYPGDIITLKETHHQGFMLADGFNNPELIFAKMPSADIRA